MENWLKKCISDYMKPKYETWEWKIRKAMPVMRATHSAAPEQQADESLVAQMRSRDEPCA